MKRIFYIVFLGIIFFFTACSPDQAVKKYYKACLKGDYAKAEKYVISAQKDSYKILKKKYKTIKHKDPDIPKVKVKDIQVRHLDDSSAIASFDLITIADSSADTLPKLVMLKKEKGAWRICNGMLFSK